MTKARPAQNECPACSAEDIEYWNEMDKWICNNCSYVVTATNDGSTSPATVAAEETSSNQTDADEEWGQNIAVNDASEANLVEVLSRTEELAEAFSLGSQEVIRAGEFVTEAWETNFMHGRTKEDTVAAAIYAVTRESGRAVPPGIIAEETKTESSRLKETHLQLKNEQSLDLDPPVPADYVAYICNTLELSTDIETDAKQRLQSCGFVGGNPVGTAAAGVYLTARERTEISLRELARTIGLSKETIWRHKRKIR